MSGPLRHSPADIVRYLLIQKSEVSDIGAADAWPASVGNEQDAPDNVVTLYDVVGRLEGRNQITGEIAGQYGVQVRVRASKQREGWQQIQDIATCFDRQVEQTTVQISDEVVTTYVVHAITRVGQIIPLGNNPAVSLGATAPSSKRWVFTLNVLVSVSQTD